MLYLLLNLHISSLTVGILMLRCIVSLVTYHASIKNLRALHRSYEWNAFVLMRFMHVWPTISIPDVSRSQLFALWSSSLEYMQHIVSLNFSILEWYVEIGRICARHMYNLIMWKVESELILWLWQTLKRRNLRRGNFLLRVNLWESTLKRLKHWILLY